MGCDVDVMHSGIYTQEQSGNVEGINNDHPLESTHVKPGQGNERDLTASSIGLFLEHSIIHTSTPLHEEHILPANPGGRLDLSFAGHFLRLLCLYFTVKRG